MLIGGDLPLAFAFQGVMTVSAEGVGSKGSRWKQRPLWRMPVLLLSSACLSGIAVVLWNRKTLSRMRDAPAPEKTTGEREFI